MMLPFDALYAGSSSDQSVNSPPQQETSPGHTAESLVAGIHTEGLSDEPWQSPQAAGDDTAGVLPSAGNIMHYKNVRHHYMHSYLRSDEQLTAVSELGLLYRHCVRHEMLHASMGTYVHICIHLKVLYACMHA